MSDDVYDEDLRENVGRGVAWLDVKHPDWWRDINLTTLNMANENTCILAQLYGAYHVGLDSLHASSEDEYHTNTTIHYGFDVYDGSFRPRGPNDPEALTQLWRVVITYRREHSDVSWSDLLREWDAIGAGDE